MKVVSKIFSLMGNRYKTGGVALDSDNTLYVVLNECNKLIALDVDGYAIKFSTNAMGYSDHCDIKSITVLDSPLYAKSLLFLLRNGELWRKSLSTFDEEIWNDPDWLVGGPKLRGASGIEFWDNFLYVAFPQFNVVRKLAIPNLGLVQEFQVGLSADTSYAVAGITFDAVNGRWVTIDPINGSIVYNNQYDFQEAGRDNYVYEIYNRCFDGDISWSKKVLSESENHDFFVTCVDNKVMLYAEPWYKLYEVDDLTGDYWAVDSILFEDVEINENSIKHFRIENMGLRMYPSLTLRLADNPTLSIDTNLYISHSPIGPWAKELGIGDLNGYGIVDFFIRYNPTAGSELCSTVAELILDWQRTP